MSRDMAKLSNNPRVGLLRKLRTMIRNYFSTDNNTGQIRLQSKTNSATIEKQGTAGGYTNE